MTWHASRRLRWTAVLGAIVAAGLFAGVVVAGPFRGADDAAKLQSAIDADPVFRVAEIPAEDGHAARGVFVQPTSTGYLCLWDAPAASSRARQGGCNRSDDPLGGHKLSASLAYDGGPAAADVKDARLIGLVDPAAASVRVLMSDGTYRGIALRGTTVAGKAYRVFGYRFRHADLEKGLGPVAVLALDPAGTEIDRQPTGFGG